MPTATPRKIAAEASAFLVVPPTLPETSDRPSTKTALDDPVKSVVPDDQLANRSRTTAVISQYPIRRGAVPDAQRSIAKPMTVRHVMPAMSRVCAAVQP